MKALRPKSFSMGLFQRAQWQMQSGRKIAAQQSHRLLFEGVSESWASGSVDS
jgi:hypothetical protein